MTRDDLLANLDGIRSEMPSGSDRDTIAEAIRVIELHGQLEAALQVATDERRETIRDLNLEWDELRGAFWLPADPGPIECQSVPHAVREAMRLADNDCKRMKRQDEAAAG